MIEREVENEYFKWLYDIVCKDRFSSEVSYDKLLHFLYDTEFIYIIDMDENRANDGIGLRRRFSHNYGFEDDYLNDYISGPCSILEMMIALAVRCEETIMDDPSRGNRTGQWFWDMVVSLGLGSMIDKQFDLDYTEFVVSRFLRRAYSPDGTGGLFTIRGCSHDLRNLEIWIQLLWYLDSIM